MKVYKKQKRKLHHKGTDFLYVISKTEKGVMLRCYNKAFKNTYFTFEIDWAAAHDINLNLPRVVKFLLILAMEGGWMFEIANKQYHLQAEPQIKAKLIELSREE